VRNIFKRSVDTTFNPLLGTLRFITGSNYTSAKATKLSTVFRCVNLLSDSIASLPCNPYTYKGDWKSIDYLDGKYNLLNVEPNKFMSAYMFKKLIVVYLLLRGNAYILIERAKSGKVLSLNLLHPDFMTVSIVDGDIRYLYSLAPGGPGYYDKSQIIHILNYTEDGTTGISTIQYAADSLGIAYSSEAHAKNFWQSGANLSGILRPIAGASINDPKAKKAKADFMAATSSDLGGASGSIVVLGDGLEYQPISINPKDSQALESRQFNVPEICRFFNVPPSLAYSETGKFSTAEQQTLDFMNGSLTPLIEKIESEMFRKLYLPSEWATSELKFDADNIMRMDAASRADYYLKLFQAGGYTPNEIREKLNAQYPVKGGNRAFIQVNMQPVDALISEQTFVDPKAPIDNQVKTDTGGDNLKTDKQMNDVQKTALNGAQVESLVTVVNNVAFGIISKDAAKSLIAASFPSFTVEQISGMIDEIEVKEKDANPTKPLDNQVK